MSQYTVHLLYSAHAVKYSTGIFRKCRKPNKEFLINRINLRNKERYNHAPKEIELNPFEYNRFLLMLRYKKRQLKLLTTLIRKKVSQTINTSKRLEVESFDGIWHRSLLIFKKKIIPIKTILIKNNLAKAISWLDILNSKYKVVRVKTRNRSNTRYYSVHDCLHNAKTNTKVAPNCGQPQHITTIPRKCQNSYRVLINKKKYILSYVITNRSVIRLNNYNAKKSVNIPCHIKRSYFFPLILAYKHYVDIFELTAGPLSNLRFGWTAIARVT